MNLLQDRKLVESTTDLPAIQMSAHSKLQTAGLISAIVLTGRFPNRLTELVHAAAKVLG